MDTTHAEQQQKSQGRQSALGKGLMAAFPVKPLEVRNAFDTLYHKSVPESRNNVLEITSR